MKATFYCDESGTTGKDWSNEQQPFLVYGGWLVLNESKELLEEKINKLLSSNLIAKNAVELKANRFLNVEKIMLVLKKFLIVLFTKIAFRFLLF